MKKYKLKVLQKKDREDFSSYLLSLIENDKCVTLINRPSLKSERRMPSPGRKWVNGIVEISSKDCLKTLQDNTFHNEYFNISWVCMN